MTEVLENKNKLKNIQVYRKMEKEYVDQFFADGSLMLKTFEDFSKHNDEQRCDKQEGYGELIIHYQTYRSEVGLAVGYDHLVLCTSMNNESYIHSNYNGCFKINDIEKFSLSVCDVLKKEYSNNVYYLAGKCIYKNNRVLEVQGSSINDIQRIPPPWHLSMQLSFLKLSKYAKQNEFRFLFKVENNAKLQSKIIKVPEAIKYCERVQ